MAIDSLVAKQRHQCLEAQARQHAADHGKTLAQLYGEQQHGALLAEACVGDVPGLS